MSIKRIPFNTEEAIRKFVRLVGVDIRGGEITKPNAIKSNLVHIASELPLEANKNLSHTLPLSIKTTDAMVLLSASEELLEQCYYVTISPQLLDMYSEAEVSVTYKAKSGCESSVQNAIRLTILKPD